ncbi:hypothetical protein BUALT_Bualt13G0094700 [Buddleja alternifolia]|uniref:DUF4283 domain-containing protein n=1 Tax=Buddleja alternifolia TaxID=168488 RepID=A0AAV6WTR3_9LAMI|nr:hypothetical protein BUALT_Bualt13G0094700 [Buddleja alternifolia]
MALSQEAQVPNPAVPPNGEAISYADKLKSNKLPQELAAKTIFISKEEDDFMEAPFQYALVCKFSQGYRTMQRLRTKFEAMGLNKGFKIGVLDHKHVWISLFDPNDYARVWMKQTLYFDSFPMRVLKWTSDFNPNEESPIMPIWIKVFGLRPHWFHRQFLYHIASLVGKLLKLNEATMDIANPMVARIMKASCNIAKYVGIGDMRCLLATFVKKIMKMTRKKKSTEEVANVEDLREKLNKKRGAGTLENESKEADGQNSKKSLTSSTSGTKKADDDVVPKTPNSVAGSKNDTESRRVVIDGQNYNVLMHAKDPSM